MMTMTMTMMTRVWVDQRGNHRLETQMRLEAMVCVFLNCTTDYFTNRPTHTDEAIAIAIATRAIVMLATMTKNQEDQRGDTSPSHFYEAEWEQWMTRVLEEQRGDDRLEMQMHLEAMVCVFFSFFVVLLTTNRQVTRKCYAPLLSHPDISYCTPIVSEPSPAIAIAS